MPLKSGMGRAYWYVAFENVILVNSYRDAKLPVDHNLSRMLGRFN
jgi:hypothetical protein